MGGMNSSNILAMMNLLKAGQSSKPAMKKEFGGKGAKKPNMNINSNIANLLTTLAGGEVQAERGRCVWVTGIPEAYQDADKLINIFGNFGNVRKVVFSEKKPDGALIELDDSRGCIKAVAIMKGKKLDGQEIKISFTKIDQAGMKNDSKSQKISEKQRKHGDSMATRIANSGKY